MTEKNHIFDCLKKNNIRQIQLLLDGGCDTDITDESGRSLLMLSLVQIHDVGTRQHMIKALLQRGADINLTDKNGKCVLTYSCVLNQIDSVKLLLDQAGIDPNTPDIHGATPLMHAASLGNCEVIKVMMEYSRSGSVVIDMKARDDNGNDVMDHAKNDSNNTILTKQQHAINSRKVQQLLESYSGNVGAVECPQQPRLESSGEAIELKDMNSAQNNKPQTKDKSKKNMANNLQKATTAKKSSHPVDFSSVPQEIRDSCIRRWAVDLKSQYDDSGRLSALLSPPPASVSRSGSRQRMNRGSSAKQQPPSSLSTTAPSKKYLEKPGGNGDEEDEDFSLESLSDLVGTVRQYAQEIRDIYAPIQKEEEERTKKKKERVIKRKGKSLQKTLISKIAAPNLAPPPVHEVCVEIHKSDESGIRQKPPSFSQSHSYEPPSNHPLASLHVENEQLSSTWPRGRQRAKSEDRNRSLKGKDNRPDINGSKMSIVSAPGPSMTFSRPQIPTDWDEKTNLNHEREILSNAFKRFNQSSNDPLLKSITENKKNMKLRQNQSNPRQNTNHASRNQQPLSTTSEVPTISIIPPPSDQMFSRLPGREPFYNESEMRSGHATPDNVVNIEGPGKLPRESKDGGNGVKSSTKGLRRRKSVEQGIGQAPVIDKY